MREFQRNLSDRHALMVRMMMMMMIRGAFNRFPDFFLQAFNIVVDS